MGTTDAQMAIDEGVERIAAERHRQREVEGWTAEHDEGHPDGELTSAAANYAAHAYGQLSGRDEVTDAPPWPWDCARWRPSGDPLRNLAKAGALIAAEIDRFVGRRERFRQEVAALCGRALAGGSPFSEFGYRDSLHVHLADYAEQQHVLRALRQAGHRAEESSQTTVCVTPSWQRSHAVES